MSKVVKVIKESEVNCLRICLQRCSMTSSESLHLPPHAHLSTVVVRIWSSRLSQYFYANFFNLGYFFYPRSVVQAEGAHLCIST